ncbi:MAG: PIN domain-containing protein [Bacteroidetes bacterium]|nr:PIN domain-containing protein [Bacteroidota bacterium]MBS1941567.1 PIN domain-containing protein [Bacteroidota bacterium]
MEEEQETLHAVKLVVDANILFSAILSRDGLVAETFREAESACTLLAPAYLADELMRLRPRMAKLASLPIAAVEALQRWALAKVELVAGEAVSRRHWIKAGELVGTVDPADIPYVALALHFKCQIWTGDKRLRAGLAANGFNGTMDTAEV